MTRAILAAALLVVTAAAAGSRGAPTASESQPFATAEPFWSAPSASIETLVRSAAASSGAPAWILGRLLARESGWRSGAVGTNDDGSHDLGIAQLGARWIADFVRFDNSGAPFDPFNPAEAIPVAARYLARLRRAAGSWRRAVAAYNCGLSRVRGGTVPAATVEYVAEIFAGVDDGPIPAGNVSRRLEVL